MLNKIIHATMPRHMAEDGTAAVLGVAIGLLAYLFTH